MEIHGFFPVKFYSFKNVDIVERTKNLLLEHNRKLTYFPNPITQTVGACLQRDENWKFLVDWIHDCLNEIQIEQKMKLNGSLKVSMMWGNVIPPNSGGGHKIHRHPNALLSGIIYLSVGAPTIFFDPVYARSLTSLEIPLENNQDNVYIQPEPGTMIVFPGYVQHTTEPHYGDDGRLSIAWNCFPHGDIEHGENGINNLRLRVE